MDKCRIDENYGHCQWGRSFCCYWSSRGNLWLTLAKAAITIR